MNLSNCLDIIYKVFWARRMDIEIMLICGLGSQMARFPIRSYWIGLFSCLQRVKTPTAGWPNRLLITALRLKVLKNHFEVSWYYYHHYTLTWKRVVKNACHMCTWKIAILKEPLVNKVSLVNDLVYTFRGGEVVSSVLQSTR